MKTTLEKHRTQTRLTLPAYRIRQDLGLWQLTFEGQDSILKHEQGIYYVAYLLTHPGIEPIHGLALALRAEQALKPSNGVAQMRDPSTGHLVTLEADCEVSEYNLQLEEARAGWAVRRNQLELEAILDDETQTEPVKAEALRELEALYDYQRMNAGRISTAAQRAVRTVRMALNRFHRRLGSATDLQGQPHPVLQAFAGHLERHLLIPSARYSGRRSRARLGLSGRFTYEPPPGVVWVS